MSVINLSGAPLPRYIHLYSSFWIFHDALRGGMDASQYKDQVLFMLFIKYITEPGALTREDSWSCRKATSRSID